MTELKPASQDPLALDTDALMRSIASKNHKFRIWAAISMLLLIITIIIGVVGIFQQNSIATNNKKHIDCIVKLLATPQKPGTTHKFITDASQTCNINFN